MAQITIDYGAIGGSAVFGSVIPTSTTTATNVNLGFKPSYVVLYRYSSTAGASVTVAHVDFINNKVYQTTGQSGYEFEVNNPSLMSYYTRTDSGFGITAVNSDNLVEHKYIAWK